MRDVECYLGKAAYTAKGDALADLKDGKGNFDFGEGGNLGYFPDVFIKVFLSLSKMTDAEDILTISVQDSADGQTYTEINAGVITGKHVAGDVLRIKIPVEHRRYVKVQTKYATNETPRNVTAEVYLERG